MSRHLQSNPARATNCRMHLTHNHTDHTDSQRRRVGAPSTSVPDWRRRSGRPRSSWLRGVLKDVQLIALEAWTTADDREGWRAQRSFADYAMSMSMSMKNLYSANSRGRIWRAGVWVTSRDKQKQQESLAIAKTTARCAQYMGALKSFESPRKRPRLLFPKFVKCFCSDRH